MKKSDKADTLRQHFPTQPQVAGPRTHVNAAMPNGLVLVPRPVRPGADDHKAHKSRGCGA